MLVYSREKVKTSCYDNLCCLLGITYDGSLLPMYKVRTRTRKEHRVTPCNCLVKVSVPCRRNCCGDIRNCRRVGLVHCSWQRLSNWHLRAGHTQTQHNKLAFKINYFIINTRAKRIIFGSIVSFRSTPRLNKSLVSLQSSSFFFYFFDCCNYCTSPLVNGKLVPKITPSTKGI